MSDRLSVRPVMTLGSAVVRVAKKSEGSCMAQVSD
jgi:hypothetical protein